MQRLETEKALQDFGKRVVKQARTNLTKKGHSVSKGLWESIKSNTKVSKNSFQLDFEMADYGMFQDKGVRGKTSSTRAPNSPYKFGSGTGKKGGLTEGIKAWVRRKAFRMTDEETGKPMGLKAKAFIITRAIYNKGIRPTEFFSRPFENEYEKLPAELIDKYGLDLETFLTQTLKNG